MSFAIMTDSLAGLPLDQIARRGLVVVPLTYTVDGEEHTCLAPEGYDSAAFFAAMKKKAKVSTSMVPPQRFVEYMAPLLQSGLDVLFVSTSSGISSSYQSACIAAQQLEEDHPGRKVLVVDSLSASLGQGILVLRAFSFRQAGKGLEETAQALLELRMNLCHIFTVDDLFYLNRGGRLSGAAAVLGTMLSIKPMLKGDEHGHIVACGKVRGRAQSIQRLAQRYDQLVRYPGDQTVFIAHGNCPEDAETLAQLIRKGQAPKELVITPFDPTCGCHAGPGALGIFFEGETDGRYH